MEDEKIFDENEALPLAGMAYASDSEDEDEEDNEIGFFLKAK